MVDEELWAAVLPIDRPCWERMKGTVDAGDCFTGTYGAVKTRAGSNDLGLTGGRSGVEMDSEWSLLPQERELLRFLTKQADLSFKV